MVNRGWAANEVGKLIVELGDERWVVLVASVS
jgi:hypothetical protein